MGARDPHADVDVECLHTLRRLLDSYSHFHSMAEQLLTSLANLDWLMQDLVYGSSLPDERVCHIHVFHGLSLQSVLIESWSGSRRL